MVETCITTLQDVNLMIQDARLMIQSIDVENTKGFYMPGFLIQMSIDTSSHEFPFSSL